MLKQCCNQVPKQVEFNSPTLGRDEASFQITWRKIECPVCARHSSSRHTFSEAGEDWNYMIEQDSTPWNQKKNKPLR